MPTQNEIQFMGQALVNLRPGARFTVKGGVLDEWVSEDMTVPGDVELQAEIQRLAAEYEAKEYQRLRYFAYPDHRAQLDLLYHDIKAGNLENGSWVQAIETIKAQHPKP